MLNGLQSLNTYEVVEAGLSEMGQKVVAWSCTDHVADHALIT